MRDISPFFIVFFLLCSIPFIAQAQLNTGFRLLDRGDYNGAIRAFEQELNQPTTQAAASYGLASTYLAKKQSVADLCKGVKLIQEVEKNYTQLSELAKNNLEKHGAYLDKLSRINRQLQQEALLLVEQQKSLLSLDTFLAPGFEVHHTLDAKLKKLRMELVRESAQNADDYLTISSLIKNHYTYLDKISYKDGSQVRSSLLRSFIKDIGLKRLDEFTANHPNHSYSIDCWVDDLNQAFEKDVAVEYLRFLLEHPNSTLDNWASVRLRVVTGRGKYYNANELSTAQIKQLKIEMEAWAIQKDLDDQAYFTPVKQQNVLNFIKKVAPSPRAYYLMKKVLQHYLTNKQWDAATRLLQFSKPLFPDVQPDDCETRFYFYSGKQQWFKEVMPIVERPAEGLNKVAVNAVNSAKGDEFAPIVRADGMKMYFSATGRPENIGGEDIFEADYDYPTDTWSAPRLVPSLSTAAGEESPLAITTDGNELLLFKDGKLYTSQLGKAGWKAPIPLSDVINSFEWIGRASFSSDGDIIIFSATNDFDEEEEYANIDLYFSRKDANGKWSEPQSLGPDINTFENERSPYLFPDNKTLFFSSNGHKGLGEMDIYFAKRIGDSWTSWEVPKNLGKETNTLDDDWGYNFALTPVGNRVYLSSQELFAFQSDIYYTYLPSFAQPSKKIPINGQLDKAIQTTVVVKDKETDEALDTVLTRPDGSFTFLGDPDQAYVIHLQEETLFPFSASVDLKGLDKPILLIEEPIRVIDLNALFKGQSAPLNNVYFDYDKAVLKPASYPELKRVYEMIKDEPCRIEVDGHTDNQGTDEYNRDLSERRADAVRRYLVQLGFPKSKINVNGYGATKPLAPNDIEKNRAKNRRVEIRLTK